MLFQFIVRESPSHHALLVVGVLTTDLHQKHLLADPRPQVYLGTHTSPPENKQHTTAYKSSPFHIILTSTLAHVGSGVATPLLVLHELPQVCSQDV